MNTTQKRTGSFHGDQRVFESRRRRLIGNLLNLSQLLLDSRFESWTVVLDFNLVEDRSLEGEWTGVEKRIHVGHGGGRCGGWIGNLSGYFGETSAAYIQRRKPDRHGVVTKFHGFIIELDGC